MMMTFAIQRCCTTPVVLKQYETSTDAVLRKLGIEVVDIKETGCCGYPLKNINFKAFVLSSARNLALSHARRLDMITFCNCCYASLKHADHLLRTDDDLRRDINTKLHAEKLEWKGRVKIKHLLEVLLDDVGVERIHQLLVNTFEGLKIATHYGCHVLRPQHLLGFDSPFSPAIFDRLVECTGAQSIFWRKKLDCCGSPVLGINDELSQSITNAKVAEAAGAGADFICTACPYCQLQFDRVQRMSASAESKDGALPSVLFTQMLGLCLGIDESRLGINRNELDCSGLKTYLADVVPEAAVSR